MAAMHLMANYFDDLSLDMPTYTVTQIAKRFEPSTVFWAFHTIQPSSYQLKLSCDLYSRYCRQSAVVKMRVSCYIALSQASRRRSFSVTASSHVKSSFRPVLQHLKHWLMWKLRRLISLFAV